MIISILGRQPEIGLAELESLFGAQVIQPLGTSAALLDLNPDQINLATLGGSIKLAEVIGTTPTVKWPKISQRLEKIAPELIDSLADKKITLGISAYNIQASPSQVSRTALNLKKIIRANGRAARIVPNSNLELNSAQVYHNNLTAPNNIELICVANNGETLLASTFAVQNIDDYSRRDFGRPKRDAFVGMLPPKLAQTMLNLAQAKPEEIILDPFCGTGVVLQEAALIGCEVYGTDISQKMINYTKENLDWLEKTYEISIKKQLEVADATKFKWQRPISHVVCEGYLGEPMTSLPQSVKLQKIISQCDTIARDFLKNLHPQLPEMTRICVALPAWRQQNRFISLPTVDDLSKMSYNQISFSHSGTTKLIYHRPDQIVARELLVLIRK